MELLHNSFACGELSPKLDRRTDLPEYYQGCRLLENFVVDPVGGLIRRPGLPHVAEAGDHDSAVRVFGVKFGKDDRYTLEWGDLYLRVFKDDEQVQSGGSVYEVVTPYAAADLFDLVFVPSPSALHIYHGDYATRVLTCDGDDDWTLDEVDWSYGPFLAENADSTLTITPSGTTGSITLTASADTFEAGHVGALWRLSHQVDEVAVSGYFDADGFSSEISARGQWEFYNTGPWGGTMTVERSYDGGGVGGTWRVLRTYGRAAITIGDITDKGDEVDDGVKYRVQMSGFIPGTYGYYNALSVYSLKFRNAWVVGVVKITQVNSATEAVATVVNTLGGTGATYRWSEGAFSGVRGYPACGAMHEQRLWAAGTEHQPNGLWAGRTFADAGDYRNMYAGTGDDDAIVRLLDTADTLRWLVSTWVLLAGTDEGVLKIVGPDQYLPITPKELNVIPQAAMGSAAIQPVRVAGQIVYVSRDARRLYELTYSDDARMHTPTDLTRLAEHISGSGIVDWAFQQQPYPILWAVTADGDLVGLTRDREAGVLAFHRHTTDGLFKSVAVLPGDTADEVWFVVRRTTRGVLKNYIERMAPFDWGDDQADCFFVDGGATYDGGAQAAVTSIDLTVAGRVIVSAVNTFSDGDKVKIEDAVGMTQVNDHVYTVADSNALGFTLKTRSGSAYVDGSAFTAYESGGTVMAVVNSIGGLAHLAGLTVDALLDGQPATGTVTAQGVYTIGERDRDYHNTIHVGRPYTYKLLPERAELRTAGGTAQGRKKRIVDCSVYVYRSAGGSIGSSSDDLAQIDYSQLGDAANAPVTLVTMDVAQNHPGGWTADGDIYIEGTGPLPMTICGIVFHMEGLD